MNYLLFLTHKYLSRGQKTHISFISWVAMAGLCVGVMALIVVLAVMSGFDRDLKEKMLRLKYDVVIEGAQRESLPPEVLHAIESMPGILGVSSTVEGQVFVKDGRRYYPCVVSGLDLSRPAEASYLKQYIVQGGLPSQGIAAGTAFLRNNRLEINDTVGVVSLDRKTHQAQVDAAFSIGLYEIDSYYILADIAVAKALLGDNYFPSIGIRLQNIYSADRVKQQLLAVLPPGYFVRTWMESNSALFSALKLEKITMFIILSLIIMVACFNIFATLTVKVVDKIKDIGILHALGVPSRMIVLIFTLQGLLLGLAGVGSGIILGVGLSLLIKYYHFVTLPESIYSIKYLPVELKVTDVCVVSLVALALALISSIIPALRITKIQPAEALRYE